MPVDANVADDAAVASTPSRWKVKSSCSMMVSPSMPTTSVMLVTRREPSPGAPSARSTSSASADLLAHRAWIGSSKPDICIIISRRFERVARRVGVHGRDRAVVAGVHGLQHVERTRRRGTSPTMMRSGRMRRLLRTRSRCVTSPRPSTFGGRVSSRHDVRLLQLELGRVLDGDDALGVGNERRQAVEQRRLAGARTAGDQDVQPARTMARSRSPAAAVIEPMRDQVVDRERIARRSGGSRAAGRRARAAG